MIEQFLTHLRTEGKSETSIKNYRSSLRRYNEWLLKAIPHRGGTGVSSPLQQATTKDIIYFKNHMTQTFKPRTTSITLIHVKVFYDFLVNQKLITDNPVSNVKNVPIQQTAPKWLDRNQVNALTRVAERHGTLREFTIISMLLHTGLRVQELCNVKLTDISLKERSGYVKVHGKAYRYREVPLNSEIRSILRNYMDQTQLKGEYLFDSQRSEQCTTRAIQSIIEKFADLTSIDVLTAHSLRHTFAHELALKKTPLNVIAMLLGHYKEDGTPNLQMTSRYVMPDFNDMLNAVEELAVDPNELRTTPFETRLKRK